MSERLPDLVVRAVERQGVKALLALAELCCWTASRHPDARVDQSADAYHAATILKRYRAAAR